jgi:molybdate transport system permease protein
MSAIWRPLLLSLEIATCATALTALVAIPMAFWMARRRFAGRTVLEALITVPLVLPPTVVGYLIIVTLGARGWIGRWLKDSFDYTIMFRFEGAVLAAAAVALPLLYIPAKAAFASVDREMEDTATLLGANRLQLFWHVSLPLARRGIVSGLILGFARALGEFGATVMVFGMKSEEKTTLPILVYMGYEGGDAAKATAAVIVLAGVSLGMIFLYNRSSIGRQE